MRLIYILPIFVLLSCGTRVPDDFTASDKQPDIYPDYKEVTVPVNMAPLTFEMQHEAELAVLETGQGLPDLRLLRPDVGIGAGTAVQALFDHIRHPNCSPIGMDFETLRGQSVKRARKAAGTRRRAP